MEAAAAALGDDWAREQLPYYSRMFDVMLLASRAWLLWAQGSRAAAVTAMQAAAAYAEAGFAPEIGHVWDPHEMLAEMHMQAGRPQQALEELNEAMRIYPNRFNSIAAAAAAAASLESSSLSSSSPTAASLYAQLLTLASSAAAVRAAAAHVEGEFHALALAFAFSN